jgi:hypothetical protein
MPCSGGTQCSSFRTSISVSVFMIDKISHHIIWSGSVYIAVDYGRRCYNGYNISIFTLFNFLTIMISLVTFCGLAKVAIFTTNVHTKHTLQIYEKLSYEALNRHFCQTAVSGWASLFSVCQQHFLSC